MPTTEYAISRGFERFVEILDQKLGEMELRIRNEFQQLRTELVQMGGQLRTEMAQMKAELLRDQHDQMLKFAAIVSLIALVFGTVMKLFEFLKPPM